MNNTTANVLVTSNNEETRAIIASVVSKSLQEAGFTDVNARVEEGDLPMQEADKVPSMLDLVRSNTPEIFNTPVTITRATFAFSGEEAVAGGESEEGTDE